MPYCTVSGCTNRSDPKRKSDSQVEIEKCRRISFHKFPQDPQKCQMWLTALELSGWDPPKSATVCSEHFANNDYENTSMNIRILKKTAVPSLRPVCKKSTSSGSYSTTQNEEIVANMSKENDLASSNVPANVLGNFNVPAYAFVSVKEEMNETSSSAISDNESFVDVNLAEVIQSPTTSTRLPKIDASTAISPSRLFNSPEKTRLREAYEKKLKLIRQQMYNLRKREKRYKERIEKLCEIIRILKRKNSLPLI